MDFQAFSRGLTPKSPANLRFCRFFSCKSFSIPLSFSGFPLIHSVDPNMLTRSLLSAVVGAAVALPLWAADGVAPMGFTDARTMLHARADIMRADNAEIARAEAEAEAAKSLSGPKVDLNTMQVWGTKTVDLGLHTGLGSYAPVLPGPLGPIAQKLDNIQLHEKMDLDGPRASVNAIWPIYTGGLISAQQDQLQYRVHETRADRDIRENTLDAQLAAKYWGVQLARSIENLRASVLTDEEEALKKAERFEAKGLISKIERMSVQVARDTARREWVAAGTGARVAETELMRMLREDNLDALDTPLFILTGDLGTLTEWQMKAEGQSPLLQKMNALQARAHEGVNAAEASFKPTVYAFGTKNLIKHYLTLPEPDWMAGIGVRITLWDNRDRSARLRAADSLVTKASAARAEAKNEIASAVEVAFLRVTQAREEFDLTASTVELARENLRLRTKSFAEGLSTSTDVDTARTQLTGAEIARRAAAYKFVVSWAMLHATAGAMPAFVESLNRPDLVPVL